MESFLLAYGRTLAAVDDGVARIRSELERTGQLDRTVFIYAGDNGYMMGEHGGLWDKRAAYERSMRIPLIVRYPRLFAPGRVCPDMALNVDILPTLLDLAGLPVTTPTHGLSLADLIRGRSRREAFLYEYFQDEGPVPTILAVRTQRWKYITYPDSPHFPIELYDLQQDPDELVNRAPEARHQPVLAELADTMQTLMRKSDFQPRRPAVR
jgi:N-acetylglucosamine-6-sulfatase